MSKRLLFERGKGPVLPNVLLNEIRKLSPASMVELSRRDEFESKKLWTSTCGSDPPQLRKHHIPIDDPYVCPQHPLLTPLLQKGVDYPCCLPAVLKTKENWKQLINICKHLPQSIVMVTTYASWLDSTTQIYNQFNYDNLPSDFDPNNWKYLTVEVPVQDKRKTTAVAQYKINDKKKILELTQPQDALRAIFSSIASDTIAEPQEIKSLMNRLTSSDISIKILDLLDRAHYYNNIEWIKALDDFLLFSEFEQRYKNLFSAPRRLES